MTKKVIKKKSSARKKSLPKRKTVNKVAVPKRRTLKKVEVKKKPSSAKKSIAKKKTVKKAAVPKRRTLKKVEVKKKPSSAKKSIAKKKTVKKVAVPKRRTLKKSGAKKKPSLAKKSITKKKTVKKKTTSSKRRAPVKKVVKKKTPAGRTRKKRSKSVGLGRSKKYMNPQHLEYFRSILMSRRDELLIEADRTSDYIQTDSNMYADTIDRASQEEEFTLQLKERDRERKLLKKIDEALIKIDNREYGFCISCGAEIGISRLEARPTTDQCIDCKELDEIRERH